MAFRCRARSLTSALRRVASHQQPRIVAPRQFSSSAHGAPKSNDTPWIIGSALVFVPTIGYLLSPSARPKPHKPHSATSHGETHVPAENTPKASSPQESTKNQDEGTVSDDEGAEVPVEEVKASIAQAVTEDAPKEAAQVEVEVTESLKLDDGAPGQTSEAETSHEQKEKPQDQPKKGTLQDDEDSEPRPTDLGKVREQSKEANAPKEVTATEDSK
ncbi:hypothetical protein B0F90DRAFT_1258819 [Multifurca ochricompacta]|uniref:Uncharacterized protein n=1 Tax=Multifurca ochricompacta TaxID=376703 RepID=A0AAD4QQA3_9AGAM|nr:hypothetical protein B0F90DRAFT_1258819 [Multifurca ochricompacta]